jgi:hypothetical protein
VRSKHLVDDLYNLFVQLGYGPRKFDYLYEGTFGKEVKFYGVELNKGDSERYSKEIGSLNPHKMKVIRQYFSRF